MKRRRIASLVVAVMVCAAFAFGSTAMAKEQKGDVPTSPGGAQKQVQVKTDHNGHPKKIIIDTYGNPKDPIHVAGG